MLNRRSFIYSASAIGAAAALPGKILFAKSPSEQINIALIGCGGRGTNLLSNFNKLPGVRIAAICDADQELVDKLGIEYPEAKKCIDMREVFDASEIDAVIVATCNHWHCLAAIWAMQAGKHVYVEKPLGHTQWEGEQVIKASVKYNRICQVGTQQRSDPMQAEIKNFLHTDKVIGDIASVRVNRFGVRKSIGLREKPLVAPKSVDYNLWLGPAQDIPMYRNQLHYDWHWNWNTGSGEMGNWGVHVLDDVRNNVFLDKVAAPKAITAAGGRFEWNDAGNTPNVHYALLETGNIPVVMTLSNLPFEETLKETPAPHSGYVVYGSQGRLEGQRAKAKAFDGDGNLIKEFNGTEGTLHQQNFVHALREGKQSLLNAPVQIGHDSTTWCNLINIASRVHSHEGSEPTEMPNLPMGASSTDSILNDMRSLVPSNSQEANELQLGPKLAFDAKLAQFTGQHAEEANSLLRRVDRKSFEVPDIDAI